MPSKYKIGDIVEIINYSDIPEGGVVIMIAEKSKLLILKTFQGEVIPRVFSFNQVFIIKELTS